VNTFQVYALAGFGAVSAIVVVAVLLWFVFKAAVNAVVADLHGKAGRLEDRVRAHQDWLTSEHMARVELGNRVSALEMRDCSTTLTGSWECQFKDAPPPKRRKGDKK